MAGAARDGVSMAATTARRLAALAALAAAAVVAAPAVRAADAVAPATVHFPSADGRTELVAYLFAPDGAGPHPAIVLLHGRAGPYSSRVNAGCTIVAPGRDSPCNAATLTLRHRQWGEYWAAHGYLALLVDSFGPRGLAHGFGRGTHADAARVPVDERTVRPLDAEGALAWLVARPDVRPSRVMLQGWSNGGSTVLNTLALQAAQPASRPRFRAALAFYPGCGKAALAAARVRVDVPLWAFLGSDDEEVSPTTCQKALRDADSPPPVVTTYDGATHDFDAPDGSRQDVEANRRARADALARAAALLDAVP
jgi:carboxymethylenebutenolidase